MQADLAPVHRWAADMIVKYQDANDKVPDWLSYYTATGMQQRDA